METRYLEAFVVLAEELHFGRAAQRLDLAQPQISKQIKLLEKEMRSPLFVRSTRSVELTAAGVALLKPARKAIAGVNEGNSAVQAVRAGLLGDVSLGFASASTGQWVPVLTREVRQQLPSIRLHLEGGLVTEVAVERVADGRLDIGYALLTRPDLPDNWEGLEHRVLWKEDFVCAMSADNPLAQESAISVRQLSQQRFVSFPVSRGSALVRYFNRMCAEAGFSPNVVQEASDELTIITLAAAGIGVAILPAAASSQVTQPELVWRPLILSAERARTAIVWRRDSTPATNAVLEVVKHVRFAAPDRAE